MPRRRVALLLAAVFVSLIVGMVAAEGVVRLALGPDMFLPVGNVYGPSPVPGVGYRLLPGFTGQALGSTLRINRLGYRGAERPVEKPAGTFRIVFIGDSHAFGFGVEAERAVAGRLERRLDARAPGQYEVLNFGVPGYNAAQQAAVFERLAVDFSPDVVVLMPSSNDHEPAQEAALDGYLREVHPGTTSASLIESLRSVVRRSKLYRFVGLVVRQRRQAAFGRVMESSGMAWMSEVGEGDVPDKLRSTVGEPLRRIIRQSRARNAEVVLAPFAGDDEYRRLFRSVARQERVPLLELLALFPEAKSWEELQARFGLAWDPHLSAEAHARWAEALHHLMLRRGMLARPEGLRSSSGSTAGE